jgi:hypothetical protein
MYGSILATLLLIRVYYFAKNKQSKNKKNNEN